MFSSFVTRLRGPAPLEPESEDPSELFSRVYRSAGWGRAGRQRFFSGPGSHDTAVVNPYVAAVRDFLERLPRPPNVVDLGCGDFNVGSRIRDKCGTYVACDVVEDLIRRNQRAFAAMDVRFLCLDIVDDPLPKGDVAFLRQVLQHLSNAQIERIVFKLGGYRYLVVTEHLPVGPEFKPNADHQAGSGIRVSRNSGVVLTAAPFKLVARDQAELCRVEKYGGVISTVVYELP